LHANDALTRDVVGRTCRDLILGVGS